MANELIQPDRFFLNRFGLNERAFERTLGTALERKADYADLYFEFRSSEALTLEESIVSKTAKSISQGVGVRVCAEDRTGYAYSDEVTVDRMRLAAETARVIADQHGHNPGAVQVGARIPGTSFTRSRPVRRKSRSGRKSGCWRRSTRPPAQSILGSKW